MTPYLQPRIHRAPITRSISRVLRASLTGATCALLAACGADRDDSPRLSTDSAALSPTPVDAQTATPRQPAPSRLEITGAVNGAAVFTTVTHRIRDGNQEIDLAAEAPPVVLLSLERADTTTLVPGIYPLGPDGMDGMLQLYETPIREFSIIAGELEILRAPADTLAGRFSFMAREVGTGGRPEQGQIQVDGTFRTARWAPPAVLPPR